MAWISITADFVKTKITGPELEALQTAALAEGQSDPLPEVTGQIVREVRGYVASNANNQMEAGATIPEGLLNAALARIRFELATRLPSAGLLDEDRRTANRDAIGLLKDVAADRFAVDTPENPVSETATAAKPDIARKCRDFDRRDQDGI